MARHEQTTLENAALRAWAKRYQEQVAAGHQAETSYLEQIAQLESQNKQLQGQINDVTQRWIDEKGKSHPIECVFTRGFVRQYNAALGYDNASVDTGHSDATAAAGTGTRAASGQPEAADAWLRDSGVSQRDVLANIIDNAKWLFSKAEERQAARFASLEQSLQQSASNWGELEKEFMRFKADLPLNYVRREDYIRGQTVIEAKLDALYNKLEVVQQYRHTGGHHG